jgi:isopenicillin N synthase-like dioxygenase
MATSAGIPTVRLRDYASGNRAAQSRFAAALRDALQEYGFASVSDHGIDPDLIRRTYRCCKRFFELEVREKLKLGGSPGGARGYTGFGIEHAKDRAQPDLKEFFHVGRELPAEPARSHEILPNRWPAAAPEMAACCSSLFEELEGCACVLLEALAESYGLPEGTFAEMTHAGNHVLRALHYPPVPNDAHPEALRSAPHEDINLITLLCEASESGLEILRPDGHWLAVEAPAGQIVVDAGDMLERLTNGVIPATTHRVVNPPELADRHRYSLPFFAHPRPESDLSVLPAFVTPERPAQTPPITAAEFLEQRLRAIGLV